MKTQELEAATVGSRTSSQLGQRCRDQGEPGLPLPRGLEIGASFSRLRDHESVNLKTFMLVGKVLHTPITMDPLPLGTLV